jgi:NAD(P)H-hydrate epimerase
VTAPVTVAQMQAIDRAAIDTYGIPRLLLMEHAGLAVARHVRGRLPSASARIGLCCGTGFNGGDGLAAARHLHGWGYALEVVLAGPLERLRDEPAIYARILERLGVRSRVIVDAAAAATWAASAPRCDLWVDALLGIGITGAVREPVRSLIAHMNASGAPVVAADVPSGLDADTGRAAGLAVKAASTVTFGRAKRGCLTGDGPAHTGQLVIEDIGLPRTLLEPTA